MILKKVRVVPQLMMAIGELVARELTCTSNILASLSSSYPVLKIREMGTHLLLGKQRGLLKNLAHKPDF